MFIHMMQRENRKDSKYLMVFLKYGRYGASSRETNTKKLNVSILICIHLIKLNVFIQWFYRFGNFPHIYLSFFSHFFLLFQCSFHFYSLFFCSPQ